MNTVRAFIGLGSNLADPVAQLQRAVTGLASTPGISVRRVSSLYRTAPWGETGQPDFINAVAEIETVLDAEPLLAELIRLEREAGRTRERRWGPRTLDLDLLLHGDTQSTQAHLQLPHPRMHQRAFVLAPLAELVPNLVLGEHGSISDLLERVGLSGIQRLSAAADPQLRIAS
ncbi:MAG: 2-amino-4-hydroxy-6-hydroxymethyldihydropteridine diphosphokinase [Xanthomonadales bacterium]|jgi:2-amino-4-hydroxy-6-hydroxymethyldihydropteridine diphosphokinase|nr:2-amino-4-hydroxy-6-hydroxymethyldihydropteridine diphosphokinase [Xanthomonadales bacterium]